MVRKLFSLFVVLIIAIFPCLIEAKSTRSSSGKLSYKYQEGIHRTYKSGSSRASYKSEWVTTSPKPTYEIGGTKYNANERYKNSGLPKVERSEAAKREFLKNKGYKGVPAGYEVDHIIPLSKGGRDEPSNMQIIPKSVHKQKTVSERKRQTIEESK